MTNISNKPCQCATLTTGQMIPSGTNSEHRELYSNMGMQHKVGSA